MYVNKFLEKGFAMSDLTTNLDETTDLTTEDALEDAEFEKIVEETAETADEEETEVDEDDYDDEDLESEDSLTFSNGVIEKIVAIAMRDVPGVVGMKGGWFNRLQDAFGASDTRKGVTVEVTPESAVRVNVSVLMEYGAFAPQVFEDVKNAVVKSVTGMTGLSVAGVNLRIEDVLTAEEIATRNNEALSEPEQRNRLDQMLVTTDEELEPEVEFEINPSEAEDVEEADEE